MYSTATAMKTGWENSEDWEDNNSNSEWRFTRADCGRDQQFLTQLVILPILSIVRHDGVARKCRCRG